MVQIRKKHIDIIFIIEAFGIIEFAGIWTKFNDFGLLNHFIMVQDQIINSYDLIIVTIYYLFSLLIIAMISQFVISDNKTQFLSGIKQSFLLLILFGLPLRLLIDFLSVRPFLDLFGATLQVLIIYCLEILFDFYLFFCAFYFSFRKRHNTKIKEFFNLCVKNPKYTVILASVLTVSIVIKIFSDMQVNSLFYTLYTGSLRILLFYSNTLKLYNAIFYFAVDISIFLYFALISRNFWRISIEESV